MYAPNGFPFGAFFHTLPKKEITFLCKKEKMRADDQKKDEFIKEL